MVQNISFKTKELTFIQKLLQVYWIIPKKWLLDYFELNNGVLYIKTKNGKELKSSLNKISTRYLIDRNENLVFYLKTEDGQKINFREVLWMLEENQWKQIFEILNPKETNLSKIGSFIKKAKDVIEK